MCNFVLRPIKSYATVDVDDSLKRGDAVEVMSVTNNGGVVVKLPGGTTGIVQLDVFVHAFTANPEDVKKVKEEEAKWFPKPKDSKKESK